MMRGPPSQQTIYSFAIPDSSNDSARSRMHTNHPLFAVFVRLSLYLLKIRKDKVLPTNSSCYTLRWRFLPAPLWLAGQTCPSPSHPRDQLPSAARRRRDLGVENAVRRPTATCLLILTRPPPRPVGGGFVGGDGGNAGGCWCCCCCSRVREPKPRFVHAIFRRPWG